jgi:phosphoserine phosphatase
MNLLARGAGGSCGGRGDDECAMEGKIAVESVFGRRLEIIRPTQRSSRPSAGGTGDDRADGAGHRADAARARLDSSDSQWWISRCDPPLAEHLGIERVEAVDLQFDPERGVPGFDEDVSDHAIWRKTRDRASAAPELAPARIVMIGDGVSDLETKPEVDLFIGFGRYARARARAAGGAPVHPRTGGVAGHAAYAPSPSLSRAASFQLITP